MAWFHDLVAEENGAVLRMGGGSLANLLLAFVGNRECPPLDTQFFSADDVVQLKAMLLTRTGRALDSQTPSIRSFLESASEGFSLEESENLVSVEEYLGQGAAFYQQLNVIGPEQTFKRSDFDCPDVFRVTGDIEAELLAACEPRVLHCYSSGAPFPGKQVLDQLCQVLSPHVPFSAIDEDSAIVTDLDWRSKVTLRIADKQFSATLYGDSPRLKYCRFDLLFRELNRQLEPTGLRFLPFGGSGDSVVFLGRPREYAEIRALRGVRFYESGQLNF